MLKITRLSNLVLKALGANNNKVIKDDGSKIDKTVRNSFKSKRIKNYKSKV